MTTHSSLIRAIVWTLVASHLLATTPVAAAPPAYVSKMEPWVWKDFAGHNLGLDFSRATSGLNRTQNVATLPRSRRARRITPNRTVPHVDPVPQTPVFSTIPSDMEIFRARVFPEPLVPVMATSADENIALVAAVTAYQSKSARDVTPFEHFLAQHPASSWRPSLLANLGSVYLQSGRPGKALQSWEAAWQATKHDTTPRNRAVADYALGNWLELTTNMGNVPAISARLDEVNGRDVGGSAGTKVRAAREGLWVLQNQHELAVPSGPSALNSILRNRAAGSHNSPPELTEYHAQPQGTSLAEVHVLAGRVGLQFQMAHASADVRVPVPSVVHLKTDHFSPVLEERDGRFRLRDMIFGGDVWVTRDALLEESSGYFLVRSGPLGDGWRVVDEREAAGVIGHCAPGAPDNEDPGYDTVGGEGGNGGPGSGNGGSGGGKGGGGGNRGGRSNGGKGPGGPNGPNPNTPQPGCGTGMPIYTFAPNRASLRIIDIPVGCTPPRGPAAAFKLIYDQREAFQPQIFTFWNAGPKWMFDWLSFVVDVPGTSNTPIVMLRGGGREQFNGTTPHWRTGATLARTSTSPIRYERYLQDGSIEVFAQSDGATSGQRRVFLTQIVDPQGQTLTFTYDSSLRLVAATDALGQVTVLEYEHPTDSLKLTSVTDPFGRTATFTYNEAGQLASITDVIGLSSSFTYGPSDFVVAMTTPYGTTAFRHEPHPSSATSYRLIEATDPMGASERLEFYWTHSGISATAPTNQVPTGFTAHNVNLNKYLTLYWDKRAYQAGADDISKATIWRWMISPMSDPYAYHGWSTNIPYSLKRPLENRIWFLYAGQSSGDSTVGTYDQPIKVARVLDDGSSQIWQATYNGIGNITSETDPLGRVTTYTYASNAIDLLEVRQAGSVNHLLATYSNYTSLHVPQTYVDAAGETYAYTYNSAGQLLTVTNPLSETTTYGYDTDGYLTSVTGAVTGSTTTFTYDDYGRVDSVTDSDGYEVTVEYDALDRPIEIGYPDSTTETIGYDKLDAVSHRDRLGRVTRTFYDPVRRVTSIRDPLGRTMTQQWGPDWLLDRLIDAKGQTTTWERDVQGRVTREIRADGTTDTSYTYETTNSRLHTVTDPEDQVKTYTYAIDNRLVGVAYTNENVSTPDVTFTYDSNYPRLATMVDGIGTTTYAYKAVGTGGALQIASIDGPLTDDTITFSYDDLGRVTAKLINGYGVSARSFDGLGRMTEEENELGTFEYTYDDLSSRLETGTYPNGQTSTYSYFGNTGDRRLQTIHHQTSGSATISKFDYTYNAIGNILTWRQQADSTAVMWQYGYDAADQLTAAVKKSTDPTPSILKRYAYGYDAAGNRSVEQIDNAVVGASHTSLNRLSSQQPSGMLRVAGTLNEAATVTIQGKAVEVSSTNVFDGAIPIASGTNTFTVTATDTNNNVTSKTYEVDSTGTTKTFSYDANGNMTSDGTRTFEWDAENRLTAIVIGSNRSEFTYDGLDRRVRIVEKQSGVTVHDGGFIWTGTVIAEERLNTGAINRFFADGEQHSSAARYIDRDHLGSIRDVTDSTAAVVVRTEYDPYGKATRAIGAADAKFGFTNHWQHSESGLVLARYRAYQPESGRWLSQDPLGHVDGPNIYAYVGSDPVNFIDPLGLCFMKNFRFSLKATNEFFFSGYGRFARTALGLMTSGATAESSGLTNIGMAAKELIKGEGVANLGVKGTVKSVVANSIVNGVLSVGALETGIVTGALIDATIQTYGPQGCGGCK